jgi:hypothetical protein
VAPGAGASMACDSCIAIFSARALPAAAHQP